MLLKVILLQLLARGNSDPSFELLKDNAEPLLLNFVSLLIEPYNASFSMDKLLGVLDNCCSTSAGPDGIENQVLSHLPSTGKAFLLPTYSHIYADDSTPVAWRESVVIPILKQVKIGPSELVTDLSDKLCL